MAQEQDLLFQDKTSEYFRSQIANALMKGENPLNIIKDHLKYDRKMTLNDILTDVLVKRGPSSQRELGVFLFETRQFTNPLALKKYLESPSNENILKGYIKAAIDDGKAAKPRILRLHLELL